jgi:hypothetical protein
MTEPKSGGTKNRLSDLRDHLFAALEGLADKTTPMDIDRAEAVAHVAQAVIHSAKVELDFLKLVGSENLPRFVEPEETAKFLAEESDPRLNPHVKGLGTGKSLGQRVS